MVKNELIKLCKNKIFVSFFILVFIFYGFYLYWSLKLCSKTENNVVMAPVSYYNELVEELSAYTDEEKAKLIFERQEQLSDLLSSMLASGEYGLMEVLYHEIGAEVYNTVHYQDIISGIISNADSQLNRLDRVNYGTLERRFMESRLKNTKEVYQGLKDITPSFYPSRGMQELIDNPIADCCCIFLILLAVFQLLTAERQNELIILSRTTVRGRNVHAVVRASALGILCIIATILFMFEGVLVIGHIYPFSSFELPIQSVYPYCALKINIFEYLCLYTFLKILFYFLCMSLIYFVCCIIRAVIPIFFVIIGMGGLMLFLYLGVSETSYLAPLRTMNPIAFGRAGELLERYQCVNIFGFAVNRLPFAIVMLFFLTLFALTVTVKMYSASGEKNILAGGHSFFAGKKKWSVNLTSHELYKTFISQKLILILAAAAVISFSLKKQGVQETTLAERFYWLYSINIEGEYGSEIPAYIEKNLDEISINAMRPDVQKGESIEYEAMLEALSRMSEYAVYLSEHEGSYYIYNPGFEALTGANEAANRRNIIISMLMYAFAVACFVLTMSIDYQRGENRLIYSTSKGRWHYIRAKLLIGMLVSFILLFLFHAPQLRHILWYYGTNYIFAPAYSLPHLEWVFSGISIFACICMRYVAIYLSLCIVMVISYLVESKIKSSIVAITYMYAVIEIPLAVMLIVQLPY